MAVIQPGAMMPIQLKLANNGPEVDTYLLSMTDTANWPLSTLPATLEVEGLSVQELTANITLAATCGASNVVTISAISQADPELNAQVEIPVIASACVAEIEPQPPALTNQPVAETGRCPLNETIDMVCRNWGQTLPLRIGLMWLEVHSRVIFTITVLSLKSPCKRIQY